APPGTDQAGGVMTRTCWGTIADALGHSRDGSRAWSTPSSLLLPVQDPYIVVDHQHDLVEHGPVVHLEKRANRDVAAVAELDDDDLLPGEAVRLTGRAGLDLAGRGEEDHVGGPASSAGVARELLAGGSGFGWRDLAPFRCRTTKGESCVSTSGWR